MFTSYGRGSHFPFWQSTHQRFFSSTMEKVVVICLSETETPLSETIAAPIIRDELEEKNVSYFYNF